MHLPPSQRALGSAGETSGYPGGPESRGLRWRLSDRRRSPVSVRVVSWFLTSPVPEKRETNQTNTEKTRKGFCRVCTKAETRFIPEFTLTGEPSHPECPRPTAGPTAPGPSEQPLPGPAAVGTSPSCSRPPRRSARRGLETRSRPTRRGSPRRPRLHLEPRPSPRRIFNDVLVLLSTSTRPAPGWGPGDGP